MIVHFVIDEKIIDQIIDNFLKISDKNVFLVFEKNPNSTFYHITRKATCIRRFNQNTEDINEVLNDIQPNAIILHQLNIDFAKAINQINMSLKIAWIEWGFDIYYLPKIKPLIYAPRTKKFLILNDPSLPLGWFIKKYSFLRYVYYKIKRECDPYKELFNAMNEIQYFCTYIKEDFEIFSKYYKTKNFTFFETAFSTVDQYLAGNKQLRISNNEGNIIIGNSNTPESNYLDVISKLEKEKDKLNIVYTVLSYGNSESHKEKVLSEGQKCLGSKFQPLVDFLPRDKYIEILQSCSVGIFSHYRQQAMGNIIALLYMGARVYLSENNPAYHFFLRKNIIVNNIENEFEKKLITRLSEVEVANNRCQLDLIFSEKKVMNDLRALITSIQN